MSWYRGFVPARLVLAFCRRELTARSLYVAAVVSVLLHAMFLFIMVGTEDSPTQARKSSQNPVSLRIVEVAHEPETAKIKKQSNVKLTQHGNARPTLTKPPSSRSSEPSKRSFSRPDKYSDLFPSSVATHEDTMVSGNSKQLSDEGHFRNADPESAEISQAQENENISELLIFTKELINRFVIPLAIRRVYSTATIYARLNDSTGRWEIVKLEGEPLFRALFFEAMGGQQIDDYLSYLLGRSTYKSVRINFALQPGQRMAAGHWRYLLQKNRIQLNYDNYLDDLIAPNNGGMLDLLGATAGVVKIFQSNSEILRSDARVRSLMLSPAYISPIGAR